MERDTRGVARLGMSRELIATHNLWWGPGTLWLAFLI